MEDRGIYNQTDGPSRRSSALSRARGRRGQMAYEKNRPMRTQSGSVATGGMNSGRDVQQERLREVGVNRNSEFKVKSPSSKGDLFKVPEA
jgi:hypothetical protein